MLELLHSSVRERRSELAQHFAGAKPFRHVAIETFLAPEFCGRLMAEFPAFDKKRAVNELGVVGRKSAIPDISRIGPAYRQFDALMRDGVFLELMGSIAGIPQLRYDPAYLGGGTHENLDGQDLDLHVDFNYHPEGMLHRRLNLIVFLNPEWEQTWGGCLELHGDPWNPVQAEAASVVPLANRAVLFETTEHSWHGFNRIALPAEKQSASRRSVAVYFYTKGRPVEETAAPHATVYVPPPLPGHLAAGYTLTDADVDSLNILIERRNTQIRFLHERETDFSQAIADITSSGSFRLGRLLTWPARKLRGRR